MVGETFWNWILIGVGGMMIVAELLLGAVTGFDLALMGVAVAAGGSVGLYFSSTKIGLLAGGILAVLYVLVVRRKLRARLLSKPTQPTNVDAVIGSIGVVVQRIAIHGAGRVKVGNEEWRASLAADAGEVREIGQTVRVEAASGVTLVVR